MYHITIEITVNNINDDDDSSWRDTSEGVATAVGTGPGGKHALNWPQLTKRSTESSEHRPQPLVVLTQALYYGTVLCYGTVLYYGTVLSSGTVLYFGHTE